MAGGCYHRTENDLFGCYKLKKIRKYLSSNYSFPFFYKNGKKILFKTSDENSGSKMDAGVQTESEVNIAAMNGNYSVFKAKKIPAWLY